ncbi:MAG: SGNH/GDSL hydrolase family protein [Pseudomonadaceae bacterium]|nr:SGNH/GDSL hydrolase family protein [Pseudomonadaceae bacterium]
MQKRFRTLKKSFLAFTIVCAVTFLLLEIALRIYNPVLTSVRGTEIILPINKRLVWTIPAENDKLDSEVIHSRNILGFRGPNPPADWKNTTTVLAIGGSTTECAFLTDGKDWPSLLQGHLSNRLEKTWVNNAGFDGHSTFGHIRLLEQMIIGLKPDYTVFLIGVNDTGVDARRHFDESIEFEGQSFRNKIVSLSETLSTVQAIYRSLKAKQLGLGHQWQLDLEDAQSKTMSASEEDAVEKEALEALPDFETRVRRIISLTRDNGIEPIFVTQPALWGDVVDPSTGVSIGQLEFAGRTAALTWQILEKYNDVTRRIGKEASVPVIDLAKKMPKDSRYYYDWMHYTNEGAEIVATIIAEEFVPYVVSQHGVTKKN